MIGEVVLAGTGRVVETKDVEESFMLETSNSRLGMARDGWTFATAAGGEGSGIIF